MGLVDLLEGLHAGLDIQHSRGPGVAVFAVSKGKRFLRTGLRQDLLDCVPHLAVDRLTSSELFERVVLIDKLVD